MDKLPKNISSITNFRPLPGNIFYFITLAGTVEAGWPSPAEEELSDTMSLDEYLVRNKEATYMLKVSGDSMVDAGIMPGDMVLVERGVAEKDGHIVIAEIDGKWTMKYLRKRGGKIYLEAANKKYRPFYPKENLKIAAVVRAVIRRYIL
ncbi:MAG: translesion error-prone DNA polymerase V autoproteolytic subunit [Candidatus Doudnabacteria bacterium]|nr:translesion error-prone DNA polymerase V autoproteolytic subunit [Candidatus Doudnabacteria bacterium]